MKKNEKQVVRLYSLNFELTYSYILQQLNNGHTLAQKISENIDFKKGSFFTFLSDQIIIDRIDFYQEGGILPPLEKLEGAKYKNFWPTPNTDQLLSEFIISYFSKNPDHTAIFEHVIAKPKDPHLTIQGTNLIAYHDEVYYAISGCTASLKIVKEVIEATGQAWYFLAVLTDYKSDTLLNAEQFNTICEQATHVILGAYDGESYLFWKKKSSEKHTPILHNLF